MINKTELIEKVENLPIYEFREVFTHKPETDKKLWNGLDEQKNFRAIVEKDKKDALSIVTDRYKLIQFKEILLPVINGLGDLTGDTRIYKGEGYTLIFPEKEEFKSKDGKLGLVIFNSVTKKYAVLIDFVICSGNHYVFLPKKVKAFKNKHIGNIKEIVENYETILTNVKEEWETIKDKFNRIVSEQEAETILENLALGKGIRKKIKEAIENQDLTLWDFLIEIIKNIQEKKYKNEVNKMRKIKFISDTIFKLAILENLK